MSDLGGDEVRTTTTSVDPATGTRETYTTSEPRRAGGNAIWIVLGLVAVIAIVALVYLFSQNNGASQQAALDQANTNAAVASQAAGDAASNAANAASNAVNAAGSAADRAASNASAAASHAADNASAAVSDATDSPPASDSTSPSSQQ